MGDPSPEAWNRVRRYASWMRRAHLVPLWGLEEDSFSKLRLNSPDNGWFPILQDLNWYITETNLPYADLFFSPHLKRISTHRLQVHFGGPAGPLNTLPVTAIASAISTLPTFALQSLRVFCSESWSPEASWTGFTDSLSSVVLRCGQSLTEFISKVPLSDTAVNHLTRLPSSVPAASKALRLATPFHILPSSFHLSLSWNSGETLHVNGSRCSNA